MREIQAADGTAGMHGHAFGEFDAGLGGGVEQVEQDGFFGVVWLCGVTGGWADTTVFFTHGFFEAEVTWIFITPSKAGLLVEVFGEGFGQAIGDGFGEDAAVGVMGVVELFGEFVRSMDADGEATDVVGTTTVFGGDVVAEGEVGFVLFDDLLAQGVEDGLHGGA